MEEQVLFAREGNNGYRIPSLAVTADGTVLAFASRRKGNADDFGYETEVVVRRSADGGRTFSAMQVIASARDTDIHHGPVVVDCRSGQVLKFCRYWPASGDPQTLVRETPYETMVKRDFIDHVMTSNDAGRTWSAPAPLALDYPAGARSCGTGNGNHGIQLDDGRMLIQGGFTIDAAGGRAAGLPLAPAVGADRQPCCCLFASDDGGATWTRAATSAHSTLREFTLAALSDGSIYYNFRTHEAGVGCRAVSRSADRGASFGPIELDPQLPEPWSHAGLLRPPGGDTLVFTNPNRRNPDGRYSAEVRRELTVRLSDDSGRTWPAARAINQAYASYFDLAALSTGEILCLYENGDETYRDRITLCRFTAGWARGAR